MSSFDEKAVLDTLEKVSKSVVNINTVKLISRMLYQAIPVEGMGSGTIIDSKGQILTNNHVVGGAEKITVTLWNGEMLEGKIVGACSVHDTAIVKVNKPELPAAELGDSEKLRVGQRVYAIGNPFGLTGGPTVTSGVISATKRTIESQRGLIENLVQTDAAINPGNSGGPLLDLEGKVVAINTAIIPYAQGIGFAIPINTAKQCTSDMIREGIAARPWLGIVGLSLSSEISRFYNLPLEHGVLVTKVTDGSPAQHAGMIMGDIILKMDRVDIDSIEDLLGEIHRRKVGDEIRITVFRRGFQQYFDVTLSAMA
ncbi:MAG: trypsin-like peptidase domain-containing protein [Candidatus Bathyarchaeota archaeon]|nr:trypsin-like peptidase domain-containing protein [Candidatus Bathyarchaeota archaeon]